ncbi:serine/threonine dehydratase [Alteromonas sediminis]|uniref:Serine/threonine dehydratase n=1 Tax=Alteromonas sediminis TaxID=2259342 RepID=A0A3N5Y1C4_9ALTE|nr:serine/threonine dehydratase [Alteromonas sediminis]RPJ66276.1 serine/threonine dehydratase [Alteromonas sediminis]
MTLYVDIVSAAERIAPYIKKTPLYSSTLLNHCLGQQIFFKCECFQTTGSFKLRGATNLIVQALRKNDSIKHVVASSSGNHAQAVAFIARELGLAATIFAGKSISPIKAAATRAYGAKLVVCETRPEADKLTQEAANSDNTLWVPPFNHPHIIAGQGTVMLEAIGQLAEKPDAVFTPCGGGGLTSGTFIVTREKLPQAKVFAAEPLSANDAAESIRKGSIQTLPTAPDTLADGAATPAVGEHTFPYLQQLDGIVEVTEKQIAYWTQWLQHTLKLHIEPTCAMTMQAVLKWARTAPTNSTALVVISGGNISQASMAKVWETDFLSQFPTLDLAI